MAKIDRFNGNVQAFASQAQGTERTIFGDTAQSNTLDANLNTDFLRGWGIVGVNENPTKQDFAGLAFTLGQLISYLHQRGIPEWNTSQEFYEGSVVTTLEGIYRLKAGGTATVNPDSDNGVNWELAPTRAEIEDRVIRVTSIAAMEAYSAPVGYVFSLNAGGRSGVFDVVAGDFSNELAADTLNGIYIGLADDPTATTKVAVRRDISSINVSWFGAEGDGTTDDYQSIREAFDTALAGQVIYLPAATYLITDTILIDKQIEILGDGWDGTEVVFSGAGKACFEWSVNPFGSKISGLKITSSLGQNSSTNEAAIKGRDDGSNRQLIIDRCYINNFSLAGVMLYTGWNCKIQNSEIRNCGNSTNNGAGFFMYGGSVAATGQLVHNCYIAGCYFGIADGSSVAGYTGSVWNSTFIQVIFESNTYPVNLINGGRNTWIKYYAEANSNPSTFNGGVIIDPVVLSTAQTYPASSVVLSKDGSQINGAIATGNDDYTVYGDKAFSAEINTGPASEKIIRLGSKLTVGVSRFLWDGQIMAIGNGQRPTNPRSDIPGFACVAESSVLADGTLVGQYVAASRDGSGAGHGSKGGMKIHGDGNGQSRVSFYTSDVTTNENQRLVIDSNGDLYPTVDNTQKLGTATNRWSEVYAGAATINTSDEREKTFFNIEESEMLVAKDLKGMIRKFKFNDAIALKGEYGARIHFGVGAQSVKATFEEYGLVAEEYSLFCYDEWDTEYEQLVDTKEVLDEGGKVIVEQTYKNGEVTRAAGNRYGIRYEELLSFIISAL